MAIELQPIANGDNIQPNCTIDTRILQLLVVVERAYGPARISDINRPCIGDSTNCPSSPHCQSPAQAVDFTALNGSSLTAGGEDTQLDIDFLHFIDQFMPSNTWVEQQQCRPPQQWEHLHDFTQTPCNHQHVDVLHTSGQQLAVTSGSPIAANGVTPLVLPDGKISLYTIRGDGNLWGATQQAAGGSFGPWQMIGNSVGNLTGRASVVQTSSGLIAAYARTSGGTIVGTSQGSSGGSFGVWQPIGTAGGGVASAPAAIVLQSGVIAIYATTDANTVAGVAQSSVGGSFGAWQAIGTTTGVGLNLRPSVLQTSDGRIVIYTHSLDNRIFGAAQAQRGGSFGTWVPMGTGGGGVVSEPAATIDQNDRISLYASAGNGTLAGVSQPSAGASFGAWVNYGSGPVSLVGTTPVLIPLGNGSNALYALGEGSTVWGSVIATGQTGPSGWAQIGSGTGPSTAVTGKRTPAGQIVLYGNDASGHVVGSGQAQEYGPFGPWTPLS